LIAAIGLTLGYLGEHNGIEGILPTYGLLFLLAIPLLACSPLVLIGIAVALTAVGPLLIVATADVLSYSAEAVDPTFTTLVHDLGAVQEVLPVGSAHVRDRPLGPVTRVVAGT
jgi:hypothetical protein